jgi:hypothetical protein
VSLRDLSSPGRVSFLQPESASFTSKWFSAQIIGGVAAGGEGGTPAVRRSLTARRAAEPQEVIRPTNNFRRARLDMGATGGDPQPPSQPPPRNPPATPNPRLSDPKRLPDSRLPDSRL